jgi:hypothetical protein
MAEYLRPEIPRCCARARESVRPGCANNVTTLMQPGQQMASSVIARKPVRDLVLRQKAQHLVSAVQECGRRNVSGVHRRLTPILTGAEQVSHVNKIRSPAIRVASAWRPVGGDR